MITEITKPTKVADYSDDVWVIWEKTKEYIPDEFVRQAIDSDFDDVLDEDEAEDLYGDVIDYINDEIAPDDLIFGVHIETGDIGFWKIDDLYTGDDDDDEDDDEDEFEENEEEEDDDEEDDEDKEVPKVVEIPTPAPEARTGVAEILDEDGEVVDETKYKVG